MVITIIISLALLMFIAYKGYPVIVFAPLCALLAAAASGYPLLPTYTEMFMGNAMGFVKNMFPIFLLGALFGKMMETTGAAKSIAQWIVAKLGVKHAILSIVLSTAILTYGGISLFVVAFTIYPLAAAIYRQAGIPKRLIAPSLAFGAFTFTYALPGLPQVQNVIPTRYFGTDAFAGGWFGVVFGSFIFIAGMFWLEYRKRKAWAAGEGYGSGHKNEPDFSQNEDEALPNPYLALLPLVCVVIVNFLLSQDIKGWNPAILEKFPGVTLAGVSATWALIVALVIGIIMIMLIGRKSFNSSESVAVAFSAGAVGSLLAVMNTATEVGYGNVISKLPGFNVLADFMMSLGAGHPLVSEAITVNILAGVTGSASGGMVIALEGMAGHYIQLAQQIGIPMDLLHRVAVMAACGLDSLPHNGAVITLLAICGLTHKQSYPDIFVVTVILPIASVFSGIFIVSMLFY